MQQELLIIIYHAKSFHSILKTSNFLWAILYVGSKKSCPNWCHSVSPLTHMSSLMGILLSLLNPYTVISGLELIFPETSCYPLESFVAFEDSHSTVKGSTAKFDKDDWKRTILPLYVALFLLSDFLFCQCSHCFGVVYAFSVQFLWEIYVWKFATTFRKAKSGKNFRCTIWGGGI